MSESTMGFTRMQASKLEGTQLSKFIAGRRSLGGRRRVGMRFIQSTPHTLTNNSSLFYQNNESRLYSSFPLYVSIDSILSAPVNKVLALCFDIRMKFGSDDYQRVDDFEKWSHWS